MTETAETDTAPISYRTLSQERAVALRVERIAELEADHYRLTLVAEETGQLSAEQHRQRETIERYVEHHAAILWPAEDGGEHRREDDEPAPEPTPVPDPVAARYARGTPVEPSGASPDELSAPLRDDEHVHAAAHSDDPVEDDPDLDDGAPLGDRDGERGTVAAPFEYHDHTPGDRRAAEAEPSRLQRTSHYPSVADRLGVEE